MNAAEPPVEVLPEEAVHAAPRDPLLRLAVAVLAVLALVAALYLARAFFVPLLIGILASYALHPLVDWLGALRVPRSIGAALVLAAVVGSFSWVGFSLSDDAVELIQKLPEAARKLRRELSFSRSGAPTALQNMQEAARELQGAASDAGDKAKPRAVAIQSPAPTWLRPRRTPRTRSACRERTSP